jgi:hypothetical protein
MVKRPTARGPGPPACPPGALGPPPARPERPPACPGPVPPSPIIGIPMGLGLWSVIICWSIDIQAHKTGYVSELQTVLQRCHLFTRSTSKYSEKLMISGYRSSSAAGPTVNTCVAAGVGMLQPKGNTGSSSNDAGEKGCESFAYISDDDSENDEYA